ncbi:hypothetical protein ACFFJY_19270 [Fictibacillus aquaticus]|uniref:N-acetyltransferase domain-containing protein n=1 Tax=Fictibacillus aquaticus TaxID=2021314 RepID=A0A235F6H7_9BACL|nr:hypothetical protein [Fictibacillus aquaticus]OYD56285.1 hypothetical protein CGZ90_18210 [Fictibacillus aquaticus]
MEFRKAGRGDHELLTPLEGEIKKQTGKHLDFYSGREDIGLFVAVENEQLCGALIAKLLPSENKGQIVFRHAVSTHPEAEQKLMQNALKWMREHKINDFHF